MSFSNCKSPLKGFWIYSETPQLYLSIGSFPIDPELKRLKSWVKGGGEVLEVDGCGLFIRFSQGGQEVVPIHISLCEDGDPGIPEMPHSMGQITLEMGAQDVFALIVDDEGPMPLMADISDGRHVLEWKLYRRGSEVGPIVLRIY
ncbi:hypothetical protein [Arsenicicoccus dermatophilus]|uniref:hypothetical protein n=1 Tax=Arsenicicoccus dermatophilus TaxID=1076331 RepID=UPI001F4C7D15|nr:hypothetical protein [Arsenicicoccus dermatophilus]MCH8614262.1 hypothetical protein [Arsenicicoccus dermatophilus]